MIKFICNNIGFISWHKYWKGIYIHCLHPKYIVRVFLYGIDWYEKSKYIL